MKFFLSNPFFFSPQGDPCSQWNGKGENSRRAGIGTCVNSLRSQRLRIRWCPPLQLFYWLWGMSYWILFSHSMCMSELHLHSGKKHLELNRRVCHRWPFPFWSIIHVVWGFSVFGCAFWQWLCVLGWLSPCPALPCSLGFIFSECLVLKAFCVSLATVILDCQGCSSWSKV